jgi:RHS repeat-associated protein
VKWHYYLKVFVLSALILLEQWPLYGKIAVDLVEIVNPDGTRRHFGYQNHLLTSQTNERGISTQYHHDVFGHVTKSTAADGAVSNYKSAIGTALVDPSTGIGKPTNPAPGIPAQSVSGTYTDPHGHPLQSKADDLGAVVESTDALGNVTKIERDVNSLPTKITDARNNVSTVSYDERGNTLSRTNAVNATLSYEYHPKFSLVIKITDALGKVTLFARDEKGNLIKITNALGQETLMSYNEQGLVISITDALGRVTTIARRGDGMIRSITDPLGGVILLEHDAAGNITAFVDQLGRRSEWTYNLMNQVLTQKNALGGIRRWIRDAKGNVLSITDENNHTESYTHDVHDRVIEIKDALNQIERISYDDNDNITALIDKNGHITYREYNAVDRLIRVIRKVGDTSPVADSDDVVTSFNHDPVGNVVAITDPNGKLTYRKFDPANRLTRIIRKVGDIADVVDSDDVVIDRSFDLMDNIISSTDPLGKVSYMKYDAVHRLITFIRKVGDTADIIDADDVVASISYDAVGNRASITDPNGKVTYFRHDPKNRLTKILRKVGDTLDVEDSDDAVTRIFYDAVDNLLSVTLPNGVVVSSGYDALNRKISDTNGANETTSYVRDPVGNITAIGLPNGNVINNVFDALNRPTSQSDLIGLIAALTYDAKGNVRTQTDGNNNTVATSYDELDRPVAVTDAENKTATTQYDKASNVIATTDRNGNKTFRSYDDLYRLVLVVDALNNATRSAYDKASNLISLTDANNHTAFYEYDDLHRRIREIYADGKERRFSHDKASNVISRSDQKGRLTRYILNDLYQLIQRDYQTDDDDFFSYDKAGWLISASKGRHSLALTRDGAGRITHALQNEQPFSYSYNVPGRTYTITYPNGQVITEKMDLRGRYSQILSGSEVLAQYTHDLADRLLAKVYGNGVSANFSYNSNNWVTRLEHKNPAMALLQGVAHTHDLEGNKTSTTRLHDLSKSEAYGLDVVYRLTNFKLGSLVGQSIPAPAQEVSFNLDPVGNWNSVTKDSVTQNRSHNEVNEITTVNSTSLAHDDNGNLTDDGQHLLNWDEENRLLEVHRKSDNALLVQNEYDALSRRVVKKSFVPALQETQFFYHQTGFLPLVETDSAGNIQKSYVWGLDFTGTKQDGGGIGGLISITNEITGRTYQPIFDTQYNTTALVDANTGDVVATFRYSSYGVLLEATGEFSECAFRFSTKYEDSETGLYYYGYRFYSPELGRWASRDPLGALDGPNLYEFVGDNPFNDLDPLGLQDFQRIHGDFEGAIEVIYDPGENISTDYFKRDKWLVKTYQEVAFGLNKESRWKLAENFFGKIEVGFHSRLIEGWARKYGIRHGEFVLKRPEDNKFYTYSFIKEEDKGGIEIKKIILDDSRLTIKDLSGYSKYKMLQRAILAKEFPSEYSFPSSVCTDEALSILREGIPELDEVDEFNLKRLASSLVYTTPTYVEWLLAEVRYIFVPLSPTAYEAVQIRPGVYLYK